jgi:alpha-glucosidase
MDEYPAITAVGEVGDAQRGLEIQGEYTAGDDRVHMCYAFEFLSKGRRPTGRASPRCWRAFRARWPRRLGLLGVLQPRRVRHASRWNLSDARSGSMPRC